MKMKIKGALQGLRQFLANESPLKMMKNAFYFTSKPFFPRYLNFCLDVLVMQQNGLIRKIRLIKFYDVTAWLTNNCTTRIAR